MEERNASVTLVRPRRATRLPVRYVTVLATTRLIQVEPVSADYWPILVPEWYVQAQHQNVVVLGSHPHVG